MQTITEIRELLGDASTEPRKRFGQNFLIDHNLMHKLLDLAEIQPTDTILEIGPGTGSLTEELLKRASHVVAVEIDRDLAKLLRQRFADDERMILIENDALAGKHELSPQVLSSLPPRVSLVANLPYNIATPLVAECLSESWRAVNARGGIRFERLTFTVQKEVAERLTASPGGREYGPASVLVALLGQARPGAVVPNSAFWPRPRVSSQMLRIDFDAAAASRLSDLPWLLRVLHLAFGQRRKQIGSIGRIRNAPWNRDLWRAALSAADVNPRARAEELSPEVFADLATLVAEKSG